MNVMRRIFFILITEILDMILKREGEWQKIRVYKALQNLKRLVSIIIRTYIQTQIGWGQLIE